MDEKERARKGLAKLKIHLERSAWIKEKHPFVFALAEQYAKDAGHFYEKKDYFSSFGASDYAYGLLDGVWLAERAELPAPL